MRLSPHKRTAMSAVADHPHPLTQEQCYERIYYVWCQSITATPSCSMIAISCSRYNSAIA